MSLLTTHILDTSNGVPAGGVMITLFSVSEGGLEQIGSTKSNQDGRTDNPLLQGVDFKKGVYQLHFNIGGYFKKMGIIEHEISFLGNVVLEFGVSDPNLHYHVPLLVSPFGYSTYRGS